MLVKKRKKKKKTSNSYLIFLKILGLYVKCVKFKRKITNSYVNRSKNCKLMNDRLLMNSLMHRK